MTWGEFKAAVEAQGVTDETKIWYVDITEPNAESVTVDLSREDMLGVTINDGY